MHAPIATRALVPLLVGIVGASAAGAQTDPLRAGGLVDPLELRFTPTGSLPTGQAPRAMPLRSLVSEETDDLEFLRGALEGVRIVQLGESGHGMAESTLLKVRLVRFLHAELGFDVIAFESDLYQCADADRSAGQDDPATTLFKCAFGVWHVEEVLPLFETLRASRAGDRPLQLAGFDVQPIGRNKAHRPGYLAQLVTDDPEFAAGVEELDAHFLDLYGRDGSERRRLLREEREELLVGYGELLEALEARRATVDDPVVERNLLLGLQTVRSIQAYVRMQTANDNAGHARARNLGMAENVRFLAEELYPDRRLILWAHNTHVRHASETIPVNPEGGPRTASEDMGSHLRAWYGEQLYTVGFYAYRGTAVNNARQPYSIPAPGPAHLEQRLAAAGLPLAFVPLDGQGAWAREPQLARYNGRIDQTLVPADQYDALVFMAEVSAPTFLY